MNRYLAIYLRDHHAAAQAGVALARRALANDGNGDLGGFFAPLAERIESDLRTLERVMTALDLTPNRLKDGIAIAGERLGRLKLNGHVRGRSPLSQVLELELLVSGIAAKAALWRSLAVAAEPRLGSFDFEALAQSADEQRAEAERLRVAAAARAFARHPFGEGVRWTRS
jgi:hypothetical protein